MKNGSQCGPSVRGSRLDADHPENGVLIPRRNTPRTSQGPRLFIHRSLPMSAPASREPSPQRQLTYRSGTRAYHSPDSNCMCSVGVAAQDRVYYAPHKFRGSAVSSNGGFLVRLPAALGLELYDVDFAVLTPWTFENPCLEARFLRLNPCQKHLRRAFWTFRPNCNWRVFECVLYKFHFAPAVSRR